MSYNILIADDSDVARGLVRKTLFLADLPLGEVHEAADGAAALEVLRTNWVDLAILDLNMPVMSGFELIKSMREDDILKNTPVIVISSLDSQPGRDELSRMDVNLFLHKPVTPEDIRDAIIASLVGEK